ncbi:hypothetical protein D9613_008022 [Agrocybe pediades]|uniref:Uncharacterized protein n=1 Tax=Agrocybe pediades TaxID=84607 RepID=A0A8H4QMI7_9AGAR|nr:hypothetical protein D9613_008022 [Agrocybe pediades]
MSSSSPPSAYIIDDQDAARVKYKGTWTKGGNTYEHMGTVTSSTTPGDSLAVNFTGTSVGPRLRNSIDGQTTVYVRTSALSAGGEFNQQLWKSPTLTTTQNHQLIVEMIKVNNNEGANGTVWFDSFAVNTNGTATNPKMNTPPADSDATPSTHSQISSTQSTLPSASSPSSPLTATSAPSEKPTTGAIAGGIVGGVLILLLLLVLLFICCRRRRKCTLQDNWIVAQESDPNRMRPYPTVNTKTVPSDYAHQTLLTANHPSRSPKKT